MEKTDTMDEALTKQITVENQCFTVCQNEKLGRYLAAARDINIGEIVIQEKPLVKGPSQITGPVCLCCLNCITPETSSECSKCGWPLCSNSACHSGTEHEPECDWTVNKRKQKVKIQHFCVPHKSYECITPIRCLYMKENNPAVWEKLCSLESHKVEREGSEKYEADEFLSQFLYRFFKINETEFSKEEILLICGVIQVNGHEVPLTEPAHVAIYDVTSMLEHSCLPNCCKSFLSNGEVVIRATNNINKGEHITICYTDPLWSTINRREHLAITKYFYCECERCNDATELGTYYSSLKCFNSKCKGYLVPEMKMKNNLLPDPTWKCSACFRSVPSADVKNMLSLIGHDYTRTNKNSIESCKLFLKHYTSRNLSLHPNHYFLTDIRLKLAQQYGQSLQASIEHLSEEDLYHKIQLCRELVSFSETLFPAEWRLRGVLMFELHAAIAEDARRKTLNSSIDLETLKLKLLESRKWLKQAELFLKYEPDVLPEGKMARQAELNMQDLNELLHQIDLPVGVESVIIKEVK